ncbi:hypothetical protein SRHO_G00079250 [Serrasalmus rhombeus]
MKNEKYAALLKPTPDDPFSATCTMCSAKIVIKHEGKTALDDHAKTKKHFNRMQITRQTSAISSFMIKKDSAEDKIAVAELTSTYHGVRHGHSYLSTDCGNKAVLLTQIMWTHGWITDRASGASAQGPLRPSQVQSRNASPGRLPQTSSRKTMKGKLQVCQTHNQISQLHRVSVVFQMRRARTPTPGVKRSTTLLYGPVPLPTKPSRFLLVEEKLHFKTEVLSTQPQSGTEALGVPVGALQMLYSVALYPLYRQTVTRQWLLYSPSTGCVYCFACKLFSSKHNTFVHGFSDWKHSERIGEHEGSVEHRACMLALYNRSRGTATIDSDIVKQIDAERQYWREVLKRVVAVIQFLGERGLAFRGDDELLGSAHNGNFLGIIELLAKFDPFLAEHLQRFGGKGKGSVSYLSSTVCEEFIHLMGQRTKQAIVNEIKESKYFSVIVDSTPDLAHVDQLTFIFRFVNNDGHVVERFLAFEPIENHSGDSLAECVVAMVENLGLDLSNCRGQSYDNASNMSGKYNGVQAHLKQRNPLICYVPCAAHSLNLVGVTAVDSSPEAGRFFDFVQAMYTFCASSTHRWGKVFRDTDIKLTLKSLSGTRWSARAESTKALWKYYAQLREALNDMSKDMEEKCVTRSEASALCDKLDTLEMAFMAYFWDTILQRFQATSLQLQKHDIDICTATQLLLSLRDFVAAQRDNFEVFEGAALNVTTAVSQEYRHDLQRTKKRKIMSDDSAEPGVAFNGKDKFRIETFNVVIDKLVSCLNHRLNAYTHLTELFDVLFMPDNVSNSELTLKANSLAAAYPSDLNMSLADELIQYKSFITEKEKHPSKMLKTMINLNLQSTFPNVYIALRLFLTVPITNCEGERSFSKLARIKNELRIRMRQNRLNSLSLLAIESDLVRQLNFDELVDDFARKKSRKKLI